MRVSLGGRKAKCSTKTCLIWNGERDQGKVTVSRLLHTRERAEFDVAKRRESEALRFAYLLCQFNFLSDRLDWAVSSACYSQGLEMRAQR